jgi:hypothetical protein
MAASEAGMMDIEQGVLHGAGHLKRVASPCSSLRVGRRLAMFARTDNAAKSKRFQHHKDDDN